jgi:glycosyltransferase involved in cell wall biosynthesis
MTNDPVSIIMPVKNVEKYISQCIDSVLNQTHTNYELIILDDSDDQTSEIIKSYSDKRINHIMVTGNISQKLNHGIKIAKFDYIARMDGDDVMVLDRIEKQIMYLNNNPEINILGTNYFCISENGSLLNVKKLPEHHKEIEFMMPIITSVLHPTVMMRKHDLMKITLYDESIDYAEDLELFLRFLSIFRFHNIQENLHFYRIHKPKYNLLIKNNRISYYIGLNYLNIKILLIGENSELIFQKGLLEYYKNNVNTARKLFLQLLKSNKYRGIKVLRYLIPSLLGNRVLNYLRQKGVLQFINRYFIIKFNFDTNNIKKTK